MQYADCPIVDFFNNCTYKFTHWNMNKNKPNLRKFLRARTGEKVGGCKLGRRGWGEGCVYYSNFEPLFFLSDVGGCNLHNPLPPNHSLDPLCCRAVQNPILSFIYTSQKLSLVLYLYLMHLHARVHLTRVLNRR